MAGSELESVWGAMKGVRYRRVIDQLERTLRNTKHLDSALRSAIDMVVGAVHAQTGTFWFYDRYGDGRIRPKAVYGGGDLGGISLLPGEGIAGQVIESGKATIVADCQNDPRWAGRVDAKTGFRTESMICVPLQLNDVVFGCIQLLNRTDRLLFDEKDKAFAEQLAEATAELFQKQGLLDDYFEEAGVKPVQGSAGISFLQIFTASDDWEMERQLRKVDEFSALRISEQKEVLALARQMRRYFSKRAGKRYP